MAEEEERSFAPNTVSSKASQDAAQAAPSSVGEPQLGQEDNPQEDWGDPMPEAVFSANHTRRPLRTEAERGQGAKTRQMNKDIVSRRAR